MMPTDYPVVDSYNLYGEYIAGFENGVQPDWLANITTGSASITYETNEGGRVRCNTGMQSADDNACIAFGKAGIGQTKIDPSYFDGLVLTSVTRAPGEPSLVANETILYQSSSDKLLIKRHNNKVAVSVGGNTTSYCIPAKQWGTRRVRQRIVWDIRNDQLWVLTGGMASEPIPNPLNPSAGSCAIQPFKLTTQDTSVDRKGYCYQVSLHLYRVE